jgi:hypothetical protein
VQVGGKLRDEDRLIHNGHEGQEEGVEAFSCLIVVGAEGSVVYDLPEVLLRHCLDHHAAARATQAVANAEG